MKAEQYMKIAARLEREAENMKFGKICVELQVHEGQVVKARFTRQDCEAFALEPKKK